MQQPNYKEVIIGFLFSLHSRRFVLALITMFITYQGGRAGLSNEVLAMIVGTASSFILGESYNDGKKSEASGLPETVAAAGDVNVGSTPPRPADAVPESVEWREDMPESRYNPQPVESEPELAVEPLPDAIAPDAGEEFNPGAAAALQAQAVMEQEAQSGNG
jgi:hypothetical protein